MVAYQAEAAAACSMLPQCLLCMKFKYSISFSFSFFEFIFHSSMARFTHITLRPFSQLSILLLILFFFGCCFFFVCGVCIFLIQSFLLFLIAWSSTAFDSMVWKILAKEIINERHLSHQHRISEEKKNARHLGAWLLLSIKPRVKLKRLLVIQI